jgi:hypothetical protein
MTTAPAPFDVALEVLARDPGTSGVSELRRAPLGSSMTTPMAAAAADDEAAIRDQNNRWQLLNSASSKMR